ncbi:MAG: 1,4-alpha-glucan branching enzyme, partial [Thermodesulfobacteriota bacterium]|nr:1,4-alpha-glucan branching enzyme [Thermodesulfobacteriota bacterium]
MNSLLHKEEIGQIVKGEHTSPHSVLGNHRVAFEGNDCIVIRTFAPGAAEASVILEIGDVRKIPMQKVHEEGLFETVVKDQS